MIGNKKYIDNDLVKQYLNTKFDKEYYFEYKQYLDSLLELNQTFNSNRKNIIQRQASLNPSNQGLVKVAFDTRKIDQETEYNPRRGLQNYSRSENFISDANKEKINLLKKLNAAVIELKQKYGREAEWQDSYARVLSGVLEKTLKKIEKTGDATDAQPTMGSLDYIQELLYVRYRLSFDNLKDLDNFEIKKIILSKDEELVTKPVVQENNVVATGLQSTGNYNTDNMLVKLFGDLKATRDNPEVERTITITIKDKLAP